jgi:hypothetical protein
VSETFLTLRRNERDMIKLHIGLNIKYPLFLSEVNKFLIFSTDFAKSTQVSNFIKIRPVGGEFLYEDGQTDRQTDRQTNRSDEVVAFSNFPNATKNS